MYTELVKKKKYMKKYKHPNRKIEKDINLHLNTGKCV